VQGVQDAAVDWFQAIARVRQRSSDDHAHRVIEVSSAHLVINIYVLYRSNIHIFSQFSAIYTNYYYTAHDRD
jgi:hypothetical protein